MHNFYQYNDLSDFGFYKPSINKIGILSVLIFDRNGLPIFSRYYGSLFDTVDENDNDVLITSAFMSSIITYIFHYTSEFFTDFGIGTSRYYIKMNKDKIYCLAINEIVNQRTTGESYKELLELTLIQLIKAVNSYDDMVKDTKEFLEMNYLENFVLHIDTILLYNFKNAAIELEATDVIKKHEFDNFKVNYSHSDQYGPINHQLLIKGIQGLIILDKNNNPLIIRDYALERNYEKNIEYYSGIAMAIKRFAETNLGTLTDFGLGKTRVLVKIKNDAFIVCLFISEILFWRITGETIKIFLEMTLKDIIRSFDIYLNLFNYNEKERFDKLDNESKGVLNEQIDLLLLENAKLAIKELD